MANFRGATALTGGGTGALDAINGALLSDGDGAIVITATMVYFYVYDDDSGSAESSPDIISPDTGAGDGRWILVGTQLIDNAITLAKMEHGTAGDILYYGASGAPTRLNKGTADQILKQGATYPAWGDAAEATVYYPTVIHRPQFTYSDTDTITIGPGRYYHQGTSNQVCSWTSNITFDFGSGGSNAGSTDLGAAEDHFLYIDDSAVVTLGSATLDSTCFLNSTTAPTYSLTKMGWYNGSDLCIGFFRTNGSNQILEFVPTTDRMRLADEIDDAGQAFTSTFADVTLTAPSICTNIGVTFIASAGGDTSAEVTYYWRTNGQSGTTGHYIAASRSVSGELVQTITESEITTDSAQIIEIKESTNRANDYLFIKTHTWIYPKGM